MTTTAQFVISSLDRAKCGLVLRSGCRRGLRGSATLDEAATRLLDFSKSREPGFEFTPASHLLLFELSLPVI
jgi:hypothetical protein